MSASLPSWVSLALGLIALGSYVYQMGSVNAGVVAEFRSQKESIERTEKELARARDEISKSIILHREEHAKNISRIDAQLNNVTQLTVDIGVLKTELKNVGETMKRIEKQLEKATMGVHHKGNGR